MEVVEALSSSQTKSQEQNNLKSKISKCNNNDIIMTSSITSMTSSLSSPVDSGVQLLDSESSEATSIMSVSGTGCEILNLDHSSSKNNEKIDIVEQTNINKEKSVRKREGNSKEFSSNEVETDEFKCQMDLFEQEFGIASLKKFFLSEKDGGYKTEMILKNESKLLENVDKMTKSSIGNNVVNSKSSPCLGRGSLLDFVSSHGILNKSLSDDVFEMEHPIKGKMEPAATEADLMNVSLTSYELLDYTSQNITLPIENDQMNVSMSEEVNENLCSQLLSSSSKNNFETIKEIVPEVNVPVIEPEPKLVEEQENIVYRRQRKKKSKSDTPKKRVSFHEDILNSTKIDDVHINHGFITHESDLLALNFFQRGFVKKPDVVKGRYSWAAEGDAPYYEKSSKKYGDRKTNSDIYVLQNNNTRFSSSGSGSSSSTGSVSSSIDEEEDSSDDGTRKKSPSFSQPKTSCLKKSGNKKNKIDTKIVHEEINIPRQKSESNLLDSNVIFGSLKNILSFSTSVPLAERGVPEGQEDVPSLASEKSTRRRSYSNFSFLNSDGMLIKDEPVKRRNAGGNLNLEIAKSNFRLSRSEGFYPNYPPDQPTLPSNVIICDSNVYEHKGISYSYEYDNFQKNFEQQQQQNKPKTSTFNLYRTIVKELSFFKSKKSDKDNIKKEDEKVENEAANEEFEILTSSVGKEDPFAASSTPVKSDARTEEKERSTTLGYSRCSSKLSDWSDTNETEFSEISNTNNTRHLNSPKRKRNSNHYSVTNAPFGKQQSESLLPETSLSSDAPPFFGRKSSSTSRSCLIDRFLKNVTLKKLTDARWRKRRSRNGGREVGAGSLYVKVDKERLGVGRRSFGGYDEVDAELERETMRGLGVKERNCEVYDAKMITQLKKEVFRSQLEKFVKMFMVRSAYSTSGDSRPLLVVLTDVALYIASLNAANGGRYRNHFLMPYVELNTILIGPSAQTVHFSNAKQDNQCIITTGCSMVTRDLIGRIEFAMRRDPNRPNMPAVKRLDMQDMTNLRRAICKQTAVRKDEEYVYYSIVDVQELGSDVVGDAASMGPSKEGPLMFKIVESSARWETAYFILKAGVMYMLSSASHRAPMKVFPLLNGACQGARRLTTAPRPHTFQIIVDGKSIQLAAPDEYAASDWLQALIHAAHGSPYKDKMTTQSCSILMTTEHVMTVREAFPCTVRSLLPESSQHQPIKGPQALSCAAILDLVSFRLPSAEQSWCILEFACREVYECGGDWILYFSSNAELENFISTLEMLWDYNNEKGESFPLSTLPETDPLNKKCVDVYMSLKNSWSSNTVHLQFL